MYALFEGHALSVFMRATAVGGTAEAGRGEGGGGGHTRAERRADAEHTHTRQVLTPNKRKYA